MPKNFAQFFPRLFLSHPISKIFPPYLRLLCFSPILTSYRPHSGRPLFSGRHAFDPAVRHLACAPRFSNIEVLTASPHSSPSPSTSSPSSSTRWSPLPNSPLQPSTSASSSSMFPSRCRRGQATGASFPVSSPLHPRPIMSAASFSSDVVLCCRHGLVRSCRLPPLVPPSRANAPSVPASQSSINPVVADARHVGAAAPPGHPDEGEHCDRAMAYANRMKKLGLKVIYPGLDDHPHHSVLASIANPGYGFGSMLCLDMGTEERANRLMHHLQNTTQFGLMAVSLGYYETLMSCSDSSTSSETLIGNAACAGLAVMIIILSTGHISGAHLNPSLTIAFACLRHFPWAQVPAYIAAQVSASICASYALKGIFCCRQIT